MSKQRREKQKVAAAMAKADFIGGAWPYDMREKPDNDPLFRRIDAHNHVRELLHQAKLPAHLIESARYYERVQWPFVFATCEVPLTDRGRNEPLRTCSYDNARAA